MNRFLAFPPSVFLVIGAILGLLSLDMPWFYFVELGTFVQGRWGMGPIFYSESPVREGPQTTGGLALLRSMTSSSAPFWIWHDASYWLMIAALVSIPLLSLVRRKPLRQSLGAHGIFFIPFSLVILSLMSWVEFAQTGVENTCIGSACMSGLFGWWYEPLESGALNWGLGTGFAIAVAAAVALLLAGSIEFGKNRILDKPDEAQLG